MAKRGYSKSERRGIIALSVAVLVALSVGPVADRIGCTHPVVRDAAAGQPLMFADDSTLSAQKPVKITTEERSDAHRRSDSIRDAQKEGKNVRRKQGKKSGKKTGKKKEKEEVSPSRRSFRDERI